jgi:putative ABC transport system permease protein
MRSLTRGHVKAGFDSVRGAKMRNFWTMLGIIIGVASVITVVAIGSGVKRQVSGQIHHIGDDVISVRPAQLQTGKSGINSALLTGLNVSGSISQRDVTTVAHAKNVAAVAPLAIVGGDAKGDNGTYKDGFVIGTSGDLSSLLNQSMAFGTFLSDADMGSDTAVLGQHAADMLFNEDVPLGHSFVFHGHEFIVRGIFNNFTTTPLSQQANFNNAMFIPYDVAQSLTNNSAPTYEILAKAANNKQTKQVAADINSRLEKSHGGQKDLTVLAGNQSLAASNNILDLLTAMIAGVAAISLVVGGIGIMNVMLVSVAERMREIGIRKAVGATNRQILSQFMIEASLLSVTGGIIGVGLAFLLDLLLRLTTSLEPVITWQTVLLATIVSLSVGIIFGSVPALKAARKHPIEALRAQ